MSDELEQTARLATIDRLSETTVKVFLDPVPTRDTLRAMFKAAGIPKFKTNPLAQRGGGTVYYSVPAVEKFFRSRTLPAVQRARGLAAIA